MTIINKLKELSKEKKTEGINERSRFDLQTEVIGSERRIKEELPELIRQLVQEEVLKLPVRDGIDGKDGRDGIEGKDGQKGKDGKDAKVVDEKELLKRIKLSLPSKRGGGGGGGDIITLSTNGNTITGSFPGTQFTLTRNLKNPTVFARGSRKTLTEDYAISGLVITFNSSQPAGPVTVDGQPL